VVYGADEHAALTMFVRKFRQPWRRIVRSLTSFLATGIFGVFLWQGIFMVRNTINLSPALYIPMKIVYLCVPLGALFGVVYGIEKTVAIALGRDKGVA
jgi:TRAP-type C4-dicarboxylate transport system permease small subunit